MLYYLIGPTTFPHLRILLFRVKNEQARVCKTFTQMERLHCFNSAFLILTIDFLTHYGLMQGLVKPKI